MKVKKIYIIIVFLFLLNASISAREQVQESLYNVSITVMDPSGEHNENPLYNLAIEDVNDKVIVHERYLRIGTQKHLSLREGQYKVHAYASNPRYDVVRTINIPGEESIQLYLEKAITHKLRVRVIDSQNNSITSSRVQPSFLGVLGRYNFRSIIDSSSGTSRSIPVDANGIAEFELRGPVPECNLRVYGPEHPDKRIVLSSSEWDKQEPFLVQVHPESLNGKITCYFDTGESVLPIVDGLNEYFGEPHRHLTGRLMSPNVPHLSGKAFNFDGNELLLFELVDGEYYVRIESFQKREYLSLFPETNLPTIIKNNKLLPEYSKLIFTTEENRLVYDVKISFSHDGNPIRNVRVYLYHPLIQKNMEADEDGICTIKLPEGKYNLQIRHRSYAYITEDIYVDEEHNSFDISMEILPVIKGRVTYQGKPASDLQVFAFYDFGEERFYLGQTNNIGEYEIPVSGEEPFAIGVLFEGFMESRSVEKGISDITTVDVELTPRLQVEIQLSNVDVIKTDDYQLVVLSQSDTGVLTSGFPLNESGKFSLPLIPGDYNAFIMNSEDNFYDLGRMQVQPSQQRVNFDINKENPLINRNQFKSRLQERISRIVE